MIDKGLLWDDTKMMGFYPVIDPVYGPDYWAKYEGYGKTPMGKAITACRAWFVGQCLKPDEQLLDVGIGSGDFVRSRPNTFGQDVNPVALAWLQGLDLLGNYDEIPNYSFWDTLEHILDAKGVVAKIKNYCFVSLPIFRDREHVLKSKHFRPDEHYWYWTEVGLINWFDEQGFALRRMTSIESVLGREDIMSYAFQRYGVRS
jgi:hypothetical protein